MKNSNKDLDHVSVEEIMARAEEIEKEMGLSSEIEITPEEMALLCAYEEEKKVKIQQEKFESIEKSNKKQFYISQKILSYVAVLVMGILCVTAVGMTSQANGKWLIEKMNYNIENNKAVRQIGDEK